VLGVSKASALGSDANSHRGGTIEGDGVGISVGKTSAVDEPVSGQLGVSSVGANDVGVDHEHGVRLGSALLPPARPCDVRCSKRCLRRWRPAESKATGKNRHLIVSISKSRRHSLLQPLTGLGDVLADADGLAVERDIEDTLRVEPLQQVGDELSACRVSDEQLLYDSAAHR